MGKLECSVVDSTTDSKFLLYNSKMNFNFFRSRHYSSHWKMTLTGSFYVLALILDVVSSAATIHTSQTSFIEGSKVVLVCKASTSDMTRWVFNSSNTLSQDCFIRDPVKKIVCDKENRWFNLTIDSIQRTDDGTYQCLNGEGDSVKVDVLVPMKADVELKVIKERTLPNDTKPISGFVDLRPNSSNDTEVIMECTTDCAYKAPIISWYGAYTGPQQQTENNKLDEKTYHTKEESCDGPLGLLRSVSRLTIAAEDKKSSAEAQQNITCSARQDFTQYGGVDLIKRGQIRVLFGVIQPDEAVRQSEKTVNSELVGGLVACAAIVAIAVVGLLIYYFCRARPKQRAQFRGAGKVEHGVELNGKQPDKHSKKEAEPMMDSVEVVS